MLQRSRHPRMGPGSLSAMVRRIVVQNGPILTKDILAYLPEEFEEEYKNLEFSVRQALRVAKKNGLISSQPIPHSPGRHGTHLWSGKRADA